MKKHTTILSALEQLVYSRDLKNWQLAFSLSHTMDYLPQVSSFFLNLLKQDSTTIHILKQLKPAFFLLESLKKTSGLLFLTQVLTNFIDEHKPDEAAYLLAGIAELKTAIECSYSKSLLLKLSHKFFYNREINGVRNIYTSNLSHLFMAASFYLKSTPTLQEHEQHYVKLGRILQYWDVKEYYEDIIEVIQPMLINYLRKELGVSLSD